MLEEKLQHEREKHKTYDQDSKEKRKKYDAAEKQIQVRGHGCKILSGCKKGHGGCQQGVVGRQNNLWRGSLGCAEVSSVDSKD